MSGKTIIFVSNGAAHQASEELWSRTAVELAKLGFSVCASVPGWSPLHWRTKELRNAGVQVQLRPASYTLSKRAWFYLFSRNKPRVAREVEKLLRRRAPNLVVICGDFAYPPVEWLELCISMGLPFVTIANGNYEERWPNDDLAERYQNAFSLALRCYFVSNATLRITEKQIGSKLPNAEVVWSQYNVDFNASPAWPKSKRDEELLLACVGRLHPPHKGQDILLEALAKPVWRNRAWHLTLYGDGPMKNSLVKLAANLDLADRVTFGGHVPVEQIWATNQVLVMPSRCEGLPLAMIEAMLCGRPVVATDVGGISEIIVDGVTGFLAGPPAVAPVAEGLERLWASRANLETMGKAGAKRLRELAPADPIRVFSEKIRHLVD